MSELAQELIKIRAHVHSWSIQSYPGKVKLPADILKAHAGPDAANKVCHVNVCFMWLLTGFAYGRY
jgi:sister-chromatid-cohesion protein PDS5